VLLRRPRLRPAQTSTTASSRPMALPTTSLAVPRPLLELPPATSRWRPRDTCRAPLVTLAVLSTS
ncbi:hypothetical protein BGZ70_003243, partial [Mortierella alpina]